MKSLNFLYPKPQELVLAEEEVPPIGPDTILIKAIVSHVSMGTEMWCYRGIFDPDTNWAGWVKYPFRPGYSMAGEVVEAGKNVADFKPGDLVYTSCPHGRYAAVEYDEKAKSGAGSPLYKIPAGLTPDEAVWCAMAGVAVVGCRRAKIEFGENVAVIGAGPVGQMTAQLAKICGAVRVVSIDPHQNRLDAALAAGGTTDILKMDAAAAVEPVERLLGMKPEVVFDCTGNYEVLPIACDMVQKYGRVILNGDTPEPSKQRVGAGIVFKSLQIFGTHGTRPDDIMSLPWVSRRNTRMLFDYMEQKRLNVKGLISNRFKPEEAPEVYRRLFEDRFFSVGVVFDWQ